MGTSETDEPNGAEALTGGRASTTPEKADLNGRGQGRGGPRTPAGKARASRNAIKHGILSASPVIPGENRGDWELFEDEVLTHLYPAGAVETALAQQIALTLWRRARLIRYETQSIRSDLETVEEDAIASVLARLAAQGIAVPDDPDALVDLLADWDELDDAAPLDPEAAAELTWALIVDLIDTIEFTWPGLPPGMAVGDYEGWTIGQVREGIDALAALCGCRPADIVARAQGIAKTRAVATDYVNSLFELEEARLTGKRLLGPLELTDRVVRHEAHLARMLARDFAQLEALQARRAGTPTPLLRVDVNGGDT